MDIHTQGLKGTRVIRLFDVALCENFPCNLVSLRQLQKRGYWWDTRPGKNCLRGANDSVICTLVDRHDQFVVEDSPSEVPRGVFMASRGRYNSRTGRAPSKVDARLWHLRLGHPGPRALEHLVNCSTGARVKGITSVQCDDCGMSKAKRQISRLPRHRGDGPGLRLALDFHDLLEAPIGRRSLMLVTDRWSGYIWDYYIWNRTAPVLILALQKLFGLLERQFQLRPRVIECDNEIIQREHPVKRYLDSLFIITEPSAPETQEQNGGAERSGGVMKTKARAMRTSAKLPAYLWTEIYHAAVYLYNRTPKYLYNWKSPYERFHTFLAHRDGIVVEDRKPRLDHLRVYGCKCFAMTKDALRKANKLQKLNPNAWIGYLVGYESTNIYRVWNPKVNKVIATRDVTFNEEERFSGDLAQLKDDLLHINQEELTRLLNNFEEPEADTFSMIGEPNGAENSQDAWEGFHGEDEDVLIPRQGWADALPPGTGLDAGVERSEAVSDQPAGTAEGPGSSGDGEADRELTAGGIRDQYSGADDLASMADARCWPYPSPAPSRPAALLAMSVREATGDSHEEVFSDETFRYADVWKAAFVAGRLSTPVGLINGKAVDRAKLQRLLKTSRSLHRRDMPALPRCHADLASHPMGPLFEEEEREHLRSHDEMKSWIEISRHGSRVTKSQVLECMWVYVYKFDKHGRFQKCKARIVVRGDQQAKSIHEETYAATLAARSFRTLMAIAARFDLELLQYDAVNAFVNAKLDKDVYMRMPPGHRKPGTILKLQKALYGLRESPLLWQRDLTATLQKLGFKIVPHEPCCMTKGGIIIFFYVDDIVLAYRKDKEDEVQAVTNELQGRYRLTGGKPLQWFLGIEIIRDRDRKLIWLSQSDYLDKIANLAERTDCRHDIPMRREELKPYGDRASLSSILQYQRKIGSVLYAAVITRPDVGFAASRLAQFNSNPGPEHHVAADQVLLYLRKTKSLALQFGGGDTFTVASDASFADNTLDRKSSQAYTMELFGGIIGWRANKQSTVTTSTTEAELLALSQAAKEAMFVSRLIQELGIKLDDQRIRIQCDNKQTIQLVHQDIFKLQTKLRHVDIHNHWLRQEARLDRIRVEYRPTNDMIADGLTKPLSNLAFHNFVQQLGLRDISSHLQQRRLDELEDDELLDRMTSLDLERGEPGAPAEPASTEGVC